MYTLVPIKSLCFDYIQLYIVIWLQQNVAIGTDHMIVLVK